MILVPVLLGAAGCSLPGQQPDYDSIDPAERTLAALETARDRDRNDIPELIEQLSSSDPAVRMIAARTLFDLTGETRGYYFADPEPKRRAAADAWAAWWKSEHNRVPSGSAPASGTPMS